VTTLAFALRARTFRSLRRHRNYRIFFTGQLVSLAGTWMQNVALAWLVIELSGSPLAIGALAFWRFVPFTIFGLVAGVVTVFVVDLREEWATVPTGRGSRSSLAPSLYVAPAARGLTLGLRAAF